MTERPILFSAPMIRALLAGTKTQTRRVAKGDALDWLRPGGFTPEFTADPANHLCPYGAPGDRLWVRETWSPDCDHHWTLYRADMSAERRSCGELFDACDAAELNAAPKWRPSIHMPRRLSRITLELTEVRVERLQDISAEDALEEGVTELVPAVERPPRWHPVETYRDLWESINGAGSWDANPWVWCLSFRRITP